MILERPRPRRRRYLWPLLLTLLVLGGLGLARINEQAVAAVGYVEGIRQSVSSLVTPASSFAGLAGRVGSMDRAEFLTVIDTMESALEEATLAVEESPESGALVGVAALYRLTLDTWSVGVSTFADGVIELADGTDSASERINVGLQQVAAGDQLYLGLLAEFDRDTVPDPITPLPPLNMINSNFGAGQLARLFIVVAGSDNSALALRADLAVRQVTSDPAWVTDPEGNLVMPASELMSVDVVVSNGGNADAPAQNLELQLVSPVTTEVRTEVVPELAPGAQTTVTFTDLPVAFGGSYSVGVTLMLTVADADPANNGLTLAFIVLEPPE